MTIEPGRSSLPWAATVARLAAVVIMLALPRFEARAAYEEGPEEVGQALKALRACLATAAGNEWACIGRPAAPCLREAAGGGGVLLIAWAFDAPPVLLVGASGAILGLLGTLAGFAVRDGMRGVPGAWWRLPSIAFVLRAQMIFDFVVPEVSSVAHACGFAVGLVLGSVSGKRKGSDR